MSVVVVGLGSNHGDARHLLATGLTRLRRRSDGPLAAVSGLYRTDPVGYTAQPDFLNAVALFRSQASPEDWLASLLAVEAELGRNRAEGPRWGPRPLDMDLLAVGEQTRRTPHLTLPHPRLRERCFVLVPWVEIDPSFELPDGAVVGALARGCPGAGGVVRQAGPEWAADEENHR